MGMSGVLQISDLVFLDWGPINFCVQPGEIIGVSGGSGSGKSLLLRAIADLEVHSGEVSLDGVACASMPAPDWRRKVGLLPAESRWWAPSVAEHFLSRPEKLVGELGFEQDVFGWEVTRLSAGERQRLALARLLDREPEVLLLDEATANLDAGAARSVETVVAESGLGGIWVSHDSAQLDRVAQRQFCMSDRKLEEVGKS